jgi:hypothetical protein
MRPDERERQPQERLDALGPAPRAELPIDREEDRTLRPGMVGILREADRSSPGRP